VALCRPSVQQTKNSDEQALFLPARRRDWRLKSNIAAAVVE